MDDGGFARREAKYFDEPNESPACPDCGRPNQFGELCASCRRDEAEMRGDIWCGSGPDYGGAFDGFTVTSDADGSL